MLIELPTTGLIIDGA